jgi:hypothetical protein
MDSALSVTGKKSGSFRMTSGQNQINTPRIWRRFSVRHEKHS